MKILSAFEAEELLAEIVTWWDSLTSKLPEGQTVEKPRFVRMAETFVRRLPGAKPCQRDK